MNIRNHLAFPNHRVVLTIVALSLGAFSATGCRTNQPVASAPPAPLEVYPEPVATPAETDPFAPPGVLNAPPAPPSNDAAVFTVPGSAPATAGGTYQVQKGDTLWSIAQRVYGSGQNWKDIAAANPDLDPNRIREGQVINLP